MKVGVVAPPRAFGFHTFRRTLASVLVANNYDPKLVQEAGGTGDVPDPAVKGLVDGEGACNELRCLA